MRFITLVLPVSSVPNPESDDYEGDYNENCYRNEEIWV